MYVICWRREAASEHSLSGGYTQSVKDTNVLDGLFEGEHVVRGFTDVVDALFSGCDDHPAVNVGYFEYAGGVLQSPCMRLVSGEKGTGSNTPCGSPLRSCLWTGI